MVIFRQILFSDSRNELVSVSFVSVGCTTGGSDFSTISISSELDFSVSSVSVGASTTSNGSRTSFSIVSTGEFSASIDTTLDSDSIASGPASIVSTLVSTGGTTDSTSGIVSATTGSATDSFSTSAISEQ